MTTFDMTFKGDGRLINEAKGLTLEQVKDLMGEGLGIDGDNTAENEFYAKLERGESATLVENSDPDLHAILDMLGVPKKMESIATVVS